jgi:hypothetical protein
MMVGLSVVQKSGGPPATVAGGHPAVSRKNSAPLGGRLGVRTKVVSEKYVLGVPGFPFLGPCLRPAR